eukprot:g4333.t1
MLQGMYRSRKAMKLIRKLIRENYKTAIDPKSGKRYYYNKRTKETSWIKPRGLGSQNLEDDEKKTPRFRAWELTEDEAASHLQQVWRNKLARRKLHKALGSVYRKVWSEEFNKFYYVNQRTGETRWTKPILLGSSDLEASPRTMKLAGIEPPKRTPRFLAADLTPDEAARHLQGMWRTRVARRHLKKMLCSVWRKTFDSERQTFYYYNKVTKEAKWTKPVMLGEDDIELTPRTMLEAGIKPPYHTPRFRAKDLTQEEAALHIQASWRVRQARIKLRKIIRAQWKKLWHQPKEVFYYWNVRTKTASWTKPLCLGSSDIEPTPRTREAAGLPPLHHTPRVLAKDLSPDEAASMLQGAFRAKRARRLMYKMLAQNIEKIWDETAHAFYYRKISTGEVHWEKPKLLGNDDVDPSPRSRAAAEAYGVKVPPEHKRTPRVFAKDLSPDEAASMLQGAFRAKRARRLMYKMLAQNIEKIWDETAHAFYYRKISTGEVHWEKPKLLGNDDVDPSPRSRAAAEAYGVKVPPEHKRTPRVFAKDLSPDEAAFMIQGAWRSRRARIQLRKMLAGIFQKIYDPASEKFYYVNKNTGESQWTKPKMLGSSDIKLTPRSAAAAGLPQPLLTKRKPRIFAKDLTDSQAASMIQGAFRAKKARRMFYKLLAKNIEKVWDDTEHAFYYIKRNTKEVMWEKPKLLGDDDVDPSPRSRAAAEAFGVMVPPKHRRTPRVFAKDLTDSQAASMIQGAFRAKRARRMLYKLLAKNIEKVWDEENKRFYYVNKKTGAVDWEKPKVLKNDDVDPTPRSRALAEAAGVDVPPPHPKTPRVLAKDLSPDQAASMLQGMWRARKARRMLYKLLAKNIEKVWDEENKRFYYVNKKTGAVDWEKPKVLKNDDVDPTPRSRALAEAAGVDVPPPHPKTPRVLAKDLSPDQAASMLQGMWRARKARRMLYKLLAKNIEKVWDEELKRFYYYDKRKNVVTWEKPGILGKDDIDPTPRSRAAAELAGLKVPPKHKKTPRVFAKDLSPDQAASMLQGMWRARKARRMLYKLVSSNYEKLWDAGRKKFYYVNKRTGHVDWLKPKVLKADDIDPTPRTRHEAELWGANVPPKHRSTPRVFSKDLTQDEASLMIQCAWRQKLAREKVAHICLQVYEKAYDTEAKMFYYFNSFTGDVTWTKPRLLGTRELDLTPRSKQHAIDDGVIPAPKKENIEGGLTILSTKILSGKDGMEPTKSPSKPKTPRFKAAELSEEEAAQHIQGAWRSHRARGLLKELVSGVYSKGFDEKTGRYFYYNSKTGESVWEKPAVLGDSDLEITPRSKIKAKKSGVLHQTPRFRASDLSEEDAAKHIQSWWRIRRARMKLKKLISGVWSKGYDKKRGSFFYYNEKTGESSWVKPKALGDMDLGLTPRSEIEALKARKLVPKPKTPRFKAAELSEEEAAQHIQGAWRSHRARGLLKELVSGVYSKGFDEKTGRYFYYNSKTGESVWEKPAVLGDSDLEITPRSKIKAKKSGILDSAEDLKKMRPRFTASELTEKEAAMHIQQAWRAKLAHRKMSKLIREAYTRGFDSESGATFYVNKKTGESMWKKPFGLGENEDIELSPRSKAKFEKAKKDADALLKPSSAKLKHLKKITSEEAVVRLQNWWRTLRARKHLQAVMQHVYTKGFDPATNEFYYYNKNSGTSLWSKPSFLGSSTPRLTPRSRKLAKSAGIKTPVRKKAEDMSEDEAAFMIQGAFRCHFAFVELQARAERIWQKGTMTHRNLGNNVVVGGTIFGFVGGVYWYTVHNLRKQGGQLEEDLDELAGEIEVEQSKQQSSQ